MTTPAEFCLPLLSVCRTMADWKDFAAIIGTLIAIPVGLVGIYKTMGELRKGREQREEELKLKRAEFTLTQHRRLFDDPVLAGVLVLIDDDSPKLAHKEMWDPKRKYLTFLEELCLLIQSGYVKKTVAYYMFGYYAVAAFEGKNFKTGMAWEERYWGLYFKFAKEAKEVIERAGNGEPFRFEEMKL